MIPIKHSPSLCKDMISKLNICVIWGFGAMLDYTGIKHNEHEQEWIKSFGAMLDYIGIKRYSY